MNGDEAKTVVGAVAQVSDRLVQSLPAQFLMLVLLNVVFICGLLWYLSVIDTNRQILDQKATEGRERVLLPLLSACIQDADHLRAIRPN